MAGSFDAETSPMTEGPLWIGRDDVVASTPLVQAIAAVDRTYRRVAAGEIVAMPKTYTSRDGDKLSAVGAISTATGLAVVKTWVSTSYGVRPLLVAWNSETYQLLAVIDAYVLGYLGTIAVTGVATAALAAEQCEVLGVIGTSQEAEGQIAAVAAVRNIQTIKIFNPAEKCRSLFAERVAERFGIASIAVATAEEAMDQAGVVATVTRSREPFVRASMLAERAHINAVGAIAPEHAELEPLVVARARRVVSDDVAAARTLVPREMSASHAPHMVSLANIVASAEGLADGGLTVFKPLGSGVSDFALAELILHRTRVL